MSREVTVLIDSRASHNFIIENLISDLQIQCTPTQEFDVQMGNDDEIKGLGVCQGLRLQLAELIIIADFFPLKLGVSDVVLGFQWLATLGDSVMNWGNPCLQVEMEGRKVAIQGDPTLSRAQVSLHNMARIIKKEVKELYYVTVTVTNGGRKGWENPYSSRASFPSLRPPSEHLSRHLQNVSWSSPILIQRALYYFATRNCSNFSWALAISPLSKDKD